MRDEVRDRQALDEILDALAAGEEIGEIPAELRPHVEAARAYRNAVVHALPGAHERHLEMLRTLVTTGTTPALDELAPRRTSRARRRVFSVVLAATLVLGASGASAAVASSDALPGDVLYPVKRAVEAVGTALERDPTERARRHLSLAERRLSELRELLASGRHVDIGAAMSAYRAEVAAAEADLGLASPGDGDLDDVAGALARGIDRQLALLDAVSRRVGRHAEVVRQTIDVARRSADRMAEKAEPKAAKPDGEDGAGSSRRDEAPPRSSAPASDPGRSGGGGNARGKSPRAASGPTTEPSAGSSSSSEPDGPGNSQGRGRGGD